jgi:predicted histidine transporter YuiF (NhaC family)
VNFSQHFCCISLTFHVSDDFDVSRTALNIVALVVVLVACLVVALIVAVVIFWRKKKQFEYKYHQLINEQEQPTELSQ